ncbi:MAG TPA: arginase [Bryobacteraceae bacterium]|nr:arginase [Bryobacteraceae bacterium]
MNTSIAIIGAPLDLGSGRRGVDMGPSAVRVANIFTRVASLGYDVVDLGNVNVAQAEMFPEGEASAKYLPQIADTCSSLATMVEGAMDAGRMPIVLGGDHSIAAGSVSGVSAHYRKKNRKIGLIWVDAHADMNTPETSPSGNVHGMPLACCIGIGPRELTSIGGHSPQVDPHNVALVGIRSVDRREREHVRQSGVTTFTMRDIDERGLRNVMEEAIRIASAGTEAIHVSYDMDVVDPKEAPGVGTPVKGGFTWREAHLTMETLSDSGLMCSMDVVEVNPVIDEANRTAVLAVELIMSALGNRIL